jgi:hypothetical protein
MMAANLGGYMLSPAADALGLGDVLKDQTGEETDEMKRRKLLLQQMKEAVNPLTGLGLSSMPRVGKTY